MYAAGLACHTDLDPTRVGMAQGVGERLLHRTENHMGQGRVAHPAARVVAQLDVGLGYARAERLQAAEQIDRDDEALALDRAPDLLIERLGDLTRSMQRYRLILRLPRSQVQMQIQRRQMVAEAVVKVTRNTQALAGACAVRQQLARSREFGMGLGQPIALAPLGHGDTAQTEGEQLPYEEHQDGQPQQARQADGRQLDTRCLSRRKGRLHRIRRQQNRAPQQRLEQCLGQQPGERQGQGIEKGKLGGHDQQQLFVDHQTYRYLDHQQPARAGLAIGSRRRRQAERHGEDDEADHHQRLAEQQPRHGIAQPLPHQGLAVQHEGQLVFRSQLLVYPVHGIDHRTGDQPDAAKQQSGGAERSRQGMPAASRPVSHIRYP